MTSEMKIKQKLPADPPTSVLNLDVTHLNFIQWLSVVQCAGAAALKNQKYGNTLSVVRQGSRYFACGHTTDLSSGDSRAEHNMDTFKLLKGNNTVSGGVHRTALLYLSRLYYNILFAYNTLLQDSRGKCTGISNNNNNNNRSPGCVALAGSMQYTVRMYACVCVRPFWSAVCARCLSATSLTYTHTRAYRYDERTYVRVYICTYNTHLYM